MAPREGSVVVSFRTGFFVQDTIDVPCTMQDPDNIYAGWRGTIKDQVFFKAGNGPLSDIRESWICNFSRSGHAWPGKET